MVDDAVVQQVRAQRDQIAKAYTAQPVAGVEIQIPAQSGTRRSLIYRPTGVEGARPVFFNIHGGGFIFGLPEMDDAFCKRVCDELKVVVISPSYRLAPEHMYPSDKEDVFDVVKYVHDNPEQFGIEADCMAIGGHSAGGSISTVVALMAKERGEFQFKGVIMDYPTCDLDTEAHAKPTPEGCLDPDLCAVFDSCYRDPEDGKDPHLSPLFATQDQLRGLPPHLVITAEGDSLCFEAEEYAKHLMAAGVPTTGRRFFGVGHGFTIPGFANNPGDPALVAKSTAEAGDMMVAAVKSYLVD